MAWQLLAAVQTACMSAAADGEMCSRLSSLPCSLLPPYSGLPPRCCGAPSAPRRPTYTALVRAARRLCLGICPNACQTMSCRAQERQPFNSSSTKHSACTYVRPPRRSRWPPTSPAPHPANILAYAPAPRPCRYCAVGDLQRRGTRAGPPARPGVRCLHCPALPALPALPARRPPASAAATALPHSRHPPHFHSSIKSS